MDEFYGKQVILTERVVPNEIDEEMEAHLEACEMLNKILHSIECDCQECADKWKVVENG